MSKDQETGSDLPHGEDSIPKTRSDDTFEKAPGSAQRENDSGLGDPSGPKKTFPAARKGEPPQDSPEAVRRGNDSGLGDPSGPKKDFSTVNPLPPPPETDFDQLQDEDEKLLEDDVFWPWFGKLLRGVILLAAAIAGFFIVTQTASFLVTVRRLSKAEQIGLGIGLSIFLVLLIWYLFKITRLWWRLRVSPQVRIRVMQALAERKSLRELSMKNNRLAVEGLKKLLDDENTYAGEEFKTALKNLKIPSQEIKKLETARTQLIDDAENNRQANDEWLIDFRLKFQEPLDEIARTRIKKYYIHAGVMTALTPYPLIDRLIVLRTCLAMLKELLEIYALKPSWDKSLILFARVILNTYVAGFLDDAAASATEKGVNEVMGHFSKLVAKAGKTTGEKGGTIGAIVGVGTGNPKLGKLFGEFIGKALSKGVGMSLQAFMVYRLGDTAINMLRPIKTE